METYKQIDLNEYTRIGEGGNGKTYVTSADSGEILKVNNARLSTLEAVKYEYDVSKAVASLGISVPAMYRIVQVGDAYATISQRIKDKNHSRASATTNPSALRRWPASCAARGRNCSLRLATPNSSPAGRHRRYWPLREPLL